MHDPRPIRRLPALLLSLGVATLGAADPPDPIPAPDSLAAPLAPNPGLPVSPAGADELGGPLIPGQVVRPIDLASALRLAGVRDLDVAIARARVCEAVAELDEARVLWLPSMYLGPNWIRHDGQAQVVEGAVRSISKSSLFVGATAAAGQGVSGPVPAGGPASVGGLTSIIRFSDAIFTPLAARQVVAAREANVAASRNDALLAVAESYFDLQRAAGRLAIAREAVGHAEALARITGSYARTGAGLEADHRRGLAELDRRRREVEAAAGDAEVVSADLVRRLRIDPLVVLAPVEPPVTLIRMTLEGASIDDLIVRALRHRPELAEARSLVEATLLRLRQAKLRPFIPSLSMRYSGGAFGGGPNSFFGDFSGRSDVDVSLYWELQNLGLADRAIARQRAAQQRAATLRVMQVQDRVAAEVVRAEKSRRATARQVREAANAVPEALTSLQLNLTSLNRAAGLPGATRPIEVLQPIQALAQVRSEYLDAVLAQNLAQFRLYHAIGSPADGGTGPAE